MNIYDPSLTVVLNNGKVILVYENGYYIRTLKGCAGTSCYGSINEQPKGVSYWKAQALKALDCTMWDILMQAKGKVWFNV